MTTKQKLAASKLQETAGNSFITLTKVVREQLTMSLPANKAELKFFLTFITIALIEHGLLTGLPQQKNTVAGTVFMGIASFAISRLQQRIQKRTE